MKQFSAIVKSIREHLQDDKSRFIFDNRLLYSLTGDYDYINKIILSLPQKKELDAAVNKCREHADQLVIWGAGNDLLILLNLYPDFPIHHLCDKDESKQQNGWRGISVMSPEELAKKKDEVFVVVNTAAYQEEIVRFLEEYDFAENRIINLGLIMDSLYSRQYFDADIMSPQEGEVFVDGGCFDCSTDKAFIKWCNGDYRKIFAFEPDRENYEKCLKKCQEERMANIELYHKGLWDCEIELSFEAGSGQGSKISVEDVQIGGQNSEISEENAQIGSLDSEISEEDVQIDRPESIVSDEEFKIKENASKLKGQMSQIGEEGTNVIKISTVAIDNVVGEEEVSLIKLDVEGAELKALQGAARTIRTFRPRLAISVYHKPEDIIEILEYILSLHDDYRLYIRHYQMSSCETIVYAL